MTKNPYTSQLLNASELLRGLSPAMVRQVLPLLDQLTPLYQDLAQGSIEFTPEPEETKRLIRTFYGQLLCDGQHQDMQACHEPPWLCSVCCSISAVSLGDAKDYTWSFIFLLSMLVHACKLEQSNLADCMWLPLLTAAMC